MLHHPVRPEIPGLDDFAGVMFHSARWDDAVSLTDKRVAVIGPDGRTLTEAWTDGPRAYRTIALPGFPNFFMLMGPHSPIGNFSLVAIAETQSAHILRWMRAWQQRRFDTAAPTAEATADYNAALRRALPGTVWASGCSSWYLAKDGTPEVWPWTPERHARMLSDLHVEDFHLGSLENLRARQKGTRRCG